VYSGYEFKRLRQGALKAFLGELIGAEQSVLYREPTEALLVRDERQYTG